MELSGCVKLIVSICLVSVLTPRVESASCEFIPATEEAGEGETFGFIMIPGAQIAGEAYKPLALKIQELFPGKVWLGLADFFLADFPNPIEISSAIGSCLDQASAAGYTTSLVYMGGHSLGGVVLETYIKDHPELASGIIMYGSYLPSGWIGSDDNLFPVPVLTLMGSLDGAGLSYIAREARETQWIEDNMPELSGRYPVHVVDRVNHAQVASGNIPGIVIENDVDAEIEADEAYRRYASLTTAFMISQQKDQFTSEQVAEAAKLLSDNQAFTNKFLQPFQDMASIEESINERGEKYTPWMIEAQRVLLGLTDEELESAALEVTTSLVSFGDLGGVKPQVVGDNCDASVQTYSHSQYSFDPLDFGSVLSADQIKAKFKLEDVVLENLCLPERQRRQCKDINQAAYELALSVASDEAVDRLKTKGRQLVFADDDVSPWGPGWEFSSGLQYKQLSPTETQVRSVSLVSEPDFIIPSAAGMHYCDLLSPYRALEWIYIRGVVHGKK